MLGEGAHRARYCDHVGKALCRGEAQERSDVSGVDPAFILQLGGIDHAHMLPAPTYSGNGPRASHDYVAGPVHPLGQDLDLVEASAPERAELPGNVSSTMS